MIVISMRVFTIGGLIIHGRGLIFGESGRFVGLVVGLGGGVKINFGGPFRGQTPLALFILMWYITVVAVRVLGFSYIRFIASRTLTPVPEMPLF